MERVLEPELMDTPEEASDYDAMDHGEVNARFCDDVVAEGPVGPSVLDVGTGTALIAIELCSRLPDVRIVAIDLAEHMLAVATANIVRARLQDRIMIERLDAKRMPFGSQSFSATVSNSLVHHIPEPRAVLSEIHRVTAPGGLVFIRDLSRPRDDAEVDRLVALYSGAPPNDARENASFAHQRELFRASLKAALTVSEMEALARDAGMPAGAVRATSDRHWTLSYRRA